MPKRPKIWNSSTGTTVNKTDLLNEFRKYYG